MAKSCPLCPSKLFNDSQLLCEVHGIRLLVPDPADRFVESDCEETANKHRFPSEPAAPESGFFQATAPAKPVLPANEAERTSNGRDVAFNWLYGLSVAAIFIFFGVLSALTMLVCALLIVRARKRERIVLAGHLHGLVIREQSIESGARWRRTLLTGAPHSQDPLVSTFDLTDSSDRSYSVSLHGRLSSGVLRENDELIVVGKLDRNRNFIVNAGQLKDRAVFVWQNGWSAETVRAVSGLACAVGVGACKWVYDLISPYI